MSDMPTILFVDDEENVLKAVSRHFLDEPYDVHTENSGKKGLEFLKQNPAPVVVSDFRMPEMGGAEFLREVAQQWPDTVRIVLSGYADITALITAINEGEIFKFVTKPWRENELKEAVRDALNKYNSHEEMRKLAEKALAASAQLFDLELEQRQKSHQRNVVLEDVAEQKRLYEIAFQSVDIPLLVFDAAGEIFSINQAAKLHLGSNHSEDPNIPPILITSVQQMLTQANEQPTSVLISGSNGTKLKADLSLMKGSSGPEGVVVHLLKG